MITYFFAKTGKCTCVANFVFDDLSLPSDLEVVISQEMHSPNEIYFDNGIRLVGAFEVSVTGNMISGIPAGTTAHINGEAYSVDDGELEIEADFASSAVTVVLMHPHYRTEAVEVMYES